ncbi:acyl-CoA dehydrogenase family protein [Rhodococcus artemisiae]|uniref:Acyl-CoA dehydrogenase family protein n=1 Tax=Rhodococcus artemisiae TaxID=714159 RepID=A0ABU7LC48_9NOCA|nr:acyl-CoA dehydrogenase family protein [Rhodococcus artemisiae]MEE2059123.1 acyl-CoA dehydrogenase family protein [Rhodococcus artemisiae]
MDSPEIFREQARAWLDEHAPRHEVSDIAEAKAFQAARFDAGFGAITWPERYGGLGKTVAHEQAYAEEASRYRIPNEPFGVGMGMCGPIILQLGTDAQRDRHLRKLLRGDEIWCQLFSEPGAGSDVAGLQTRAVHDDEGWLISGQKVWTSRAQFADFGILLARTDPTVPKHQGITMFIVDMHADGVDVRPLKDMSGGAYFNEVYFDSVRVRDDVVVGQVNDGWNAAVAMLRFERIAIGTSLKAKANPLSGEKLAELARTCGKIGDPRLRSELASHVIEERATRAFGALLQDMKKSGVDPGALGSVAKLAGGELARRASDLAVRIGGLQSAGWLDGDRESAELSRAIDATPSSSIAGGTNEIQRNIIGERVLGLPKDPSADRGVPFRDLKVGTRRD